MKTHYSEQQLSDYAGYYAEHGAVRLPGLIEPEWVERISKTINEVAASCDEPHSADSAVSFGRAPGRMTIRYMWREISAVREFLLRETLAYPIARIIDSSQLRFWFDLTFIHQGGGDGEAGAGSGWHHDIAAFPFKGMQLPSLWMAMTPSDAQRSRLMFIDRSHKTAPGFYRTPDAKIPPEGESDGFLAMPDMDALVEQGQESILTWDCQPGDAIMIHPYAIHGARGNTASGPNGRRVAITTRWLGDDVRFLPTTPYAQSLKAPGMAQSKLVIGGPPSGEFFPLVWDGRTQQKAA